MLKSFVDNPEKFNPQVRLDKDIVSREMARMKTRDSGHVISSSVGKSRTFWLLFLTGFLLVMRHLESIYRNEST